MRRSTLILLFIVSIILPAIKLDSAAAQASISSIVINEIQTGGLDELLLEDGKQEFIELHNQSIETVDITGWKLQYFSATRLDVFDPTAAPTRELALLNGMFSAKSHVLLSYEGFISNADEYFGQGSTATSGLLARSGGHIRILTSEGTISDVVGWGTAKSPETKALAEINAGFSVERKINDTFVVDTNNNFEDFLVLNTASPQGGGLTEPESLEEPEFVIPPCRGLIISEVFPNPDGTDTGHEFIELYNPTETEIYLEDCRLLTSASTKQFSFPIGLKVQPKEFKVFFDSTTGLTLANAAGGLVTLIGSDADYLITYPADMAANHSWSLIGETWHDSTQPTPNAMNTLPTPEVLAVSDEEDTVESCGPGRYRSPETNRCRNLQTPTATLSACSVGQTRNPETNRCRSITSLANSLLPCKAGQERNPETNRCRNVNVAGTNTTECQKGYERNPETNRCKKAAVTLAASPSVGSSSNAATGRLNYAFLTVMSILVLGYGAYEYRRDISNVIAKLKAGKIAKAFSK